MYINFYYIILLANYLFTNIKHTYNFVGLDEWIKNISDKKIYLINNNYCIISNSKIFYNTYLCVQNISPKINYVDFSKYNINPIINTIKSTNNSYNFINWIFYIYIGYILMKFIIKLILMYLGVNQQNSSNQSDETSSSDSIFGNLYSSNLFGNLFSQIEVKSDKDSSITIDNFIGCANIKKDINKVISQLKFNSLYQLNCCELPRGLLLIGPPGCGKTHLVKTIINATGMNYIFTSGSDINKLFVGSGSITISQIFKKARENKPCLIFFDEADTLLKKRNHSESTSSSTEYGSTICKLLAEMDSLKTESGVIVIFATNMNEDYIDKGVIRTGRVDQIININNPTFDERINLFKMYLGKLLNEQINLDTVSKLSYGLTGSDIKKIVNSIKINKVNNYIGTNESIDDFLDKIIPININTTDIDNEISKCILGLEREHKINDINKKIIAYHEAGHAVMAFLLYDSIIPSKICISINSKSLGYTLFPQDDEDLLMKTSIKQLLIEIMILYAGRASEKLFVNEITCGAEDDYMKARKILKKLVMNGMLIPEYNFVEQANYNEQKVPEYVETKIKIINKKILNKINDLLNEFAILIHETANKIIENNSILGDDITNIFKSNNFEDKINFYDITELYNELTIELYVNE